jgi:hypothetical protein
MWHMTNFDVHLFRISQRQPGRTHFPVPELVQTLLFTEPPVNQFDCNNRENLAGLPN